MTLRELCDLIETDYITRGRKSLPGLKNSLRHPSNRFQSDEPVLNITTARIMAQVRDRKVEEKTADATINKELAALGQAFTLGKQEGVLNSTPHVPKLNPNNASAREGFLTAGDMEAVCAELAPLLRAFVRFAFLAVWRNGELIPYAGRSPGLRRSDVDFEAQEDERANLADHLPGQPAERKTVPLAQ